MLLRSMRGGDSGTLPHTAEAARVLWLRSVTDPVLLHALFGCAVPPVFHFPAFVKSCWVWVWKPCEVPVWCVLSVQHASHAQHSAHVYHVAFRVLLRLAVRACFGLMRVVDRMLRVISWRLNE